MYCWVSVFWVYYYYFSALWFEFWACDLSVVGRCRSPQRERAGPGTPTRPPEACMLLSGPWGPTAPLECTVCYSANISVRERERSEILTPPASPNGLLCIICFRLFSVVQKSTLSRRLLYTRYSWRICPFLRSWVVMIMINIVIITSIGYPSHSTDWKYMTCSAA